MTRWGNHVIWKVAIPSKDDSKHNVFEMEEDCFVGEMLGFINLKVESRSRKDRWCKRKQGSERSRVLSAKLRFQSSLCISLLFSIVLGFIFPRARTSCLFVETLAPSSGLS